MEDRSQRGFPARALLSSEGAEGSGSICRKAGETFPDLLCS